MKNAFTVDLEDWYHGNFIDKSVKPRLLYEDKLVEQTNRILFLLEKTKNKATFFVLGVDAERFPKLIKKIHNQGHEIASHGYEHLTIHNRSREEFNHDLKRSLIILEDIIEGKIIGFRGPYWSVKREFKWIWEVLIENGIKYDSSIFPFKTFLFGDKKAPRFNYKIETHSTSIQEIPPTVLSINNIRIPFSGGFFFRLLPYCVTKMGLRKINLQEKQPCVSYIHPWEIDPKAPINTENWVDRFILGYNRKNLEMKIMRLMNEFRFTTIKDTFINEISHSK